MRNAARSVFLAALTAVVAGGASPARAATAEVPADALLPAGEELSIPAPADRIVATLADERLRLLVAEALDRNPGLAVARARAAATADGAPRAGALPDPKLGVTWFAAPPETRVGPQRFSIGLSQRLPWGTGRDLRERAVVEGSQAMLAAVEAERLRLLTEVRRLFIEIAFLDRSRKINQEFKLHLEQHEEVARARYATGSGPGQGVLKLQAEITRVDGRLLEIASRRAALTARLNQLRDRPAGGRFGDVEWPGVAPADLDPERLTAIAWERRPELWGVDRRIARTATLEEAEAKASRPDFTVGLYYAMVDRWHDAPGEAMPPADNGRDVFGIQGGVTLPVWRQRRTAGVEEAAGQRRAAEAERRSIEGQIEAELADLTERLPLIWRRLRLLEDLLIVQAEEALGSAQAAYVTGTSNALDLLDAEHVLYEARIAIARAATDYAVGLAALEGIVGEPVSTSDSMENQAP